MDADRGGSDETGHGAIVSAVGTARGTSRATATIGAEHARTGRRITADGDHALAQAWSECASRMELSSHPGCARFVSEIVKAPLVVGPVRGFRGRPLDPGVIPARGEMGPPPPGAIKPGRYNGVDAPVLYLSDQVDGVLRECTDDGGPLWMQGYEVPACAKIVDTGSAAAGAFINQVFWFAELVDGHDGGAEPTFSQFVAELVEPDFDGMIVRGVQGDHGAHYCNLVMFRPEGLWEAWLVPYASPTRIRG